MRLALHSDIHGNLHALEAVLDELKRERKRTLKHDDVSPIPWEGG